MLRIPSILAVVLSAGLSADVAHGQGLNVTLGADEPGDAAPSSALTRRCDELAASPFDSGRPAGVAGVAYGAIQQPAASDACKAAAESGADPARMAFNYGRALQATGRSADAASWYRKSADAGFPLAQNNLGTLLEKGDGVPKDREAAGKLFRQAAAQGLPIAMFNLGDTFATGGFGTPDPQLALTFYEGAADAGFLEASRKAAKLLESGTGLPASDPERAAGHWRTLAATGDAEALYSIGYAIREGKIKPASPTEMVDTLTRAAEKGSRPAAFNLAQIYDQGAGGVSRDAALGLKFAYRALDLAREDEKMGAGAPLYQQKWAAELVIARIDKDGLAPRDAAELSTLRDDFAGSDTGRFLVPLTCEGQSEKTTVTIYLWDWKRDYPSSDPQLEFWRTTAKCSNPDVLKSFRTLYGIARERKVSFSKLVSESLDTTQNAEKPTVALEPKPSFAASSVQASQPSPPDKTGPQSPPLAQNSSQLTPEQKTIRECAGLLISNEKTVRSVFTESRGGKELNKKYLSQTCKNEDISRNTSLFLSNCERYIDDMALMPEAYNLSVDTSNFLPPLKYLANSCGWTVTAPVSVGDKGAQASPSTVGKIDEAASEARQGTSQSGAPSQSPSAASVQEAELDFEACKPQLIKSFDSASALVKAADSKWTIDLKKIEPVCRDPAARSAAKDIVWRCENAIAGAKRKLREGGPDAKDSAESLDVLPKTLALLSGACGWSEVRKGSSDRAPAAAAPMPPAPSNAVAEASFEECSQLIANTSRLTDAVKTEARAAGQLRRSFLDQTCRNNETFRQFNTVLFGCTGSISEMLDAPAFRRFRGEIESRKVVSKFLSNSCNWPNRRVVEGRESDRLLPQNVTRRTESAASTSAGSEDAIDKRYDENARAIETYLSSTSKFKQFYPNDELRLMLVKSFISSALEGKLQIPEVVRPGLHPTRYTKEQWSRVTRAADCLAPRQRAIVEQNRAFEASSDPAERNRSNYMIGQYESSPMNEKQLPVALSKHVEAALWVAIDQCGLDLRPTEAEAETFIRHTACATRADEFVTKNADGALALIDVFKDQERLSEKQITERFIKHKSTIQNMCKDWKSFRPGYDKNECNKIETQSVTLVQAMAGSMKSCPAFLKIK